MFKFIPREDAFFDLFQQAAHNMIQGSRILKELMEKFEGQCYFTPKKMGAQTAEANINAGIAAIDQIIGFFEKGDRTFQVNK